MSDMPAAFAVIIPAAGSASRFGADKLAEPLGGANVLTQTVRAFAQRADVRQIVLVTTDAERTRSLLTAALPDDRIAFAPGGQSRAHSVRNGLNAVSPDTEWVAVHDGARPLVSQPLIDRTLAAAVQHGAAVPALPVTLTIKQAAAPLPARVERTLPRQNLWAMQTPQIARRRALLDAFNNCPIPLDQVTDDMQLIELAGGEVWLVPGEEQNLKITTPLDLKIATLL